MSCFSASANLFNHIAIIVKISTKFMQIVFVVFPPQFSTTDTWPASDDGRTHIEITSGGKADQTFALPHTHTHTHPWEYDCYRPQKRSNPWVEFLTSWPFRTELLHECECVTFGGDAHSGWTARTVPVPSSHLGICQVSNFRWRKS